MESVKWQQFSEEEKEKVQPELLSKSAWILLRQIRKDSEGEIAITKRVEIAEKILQLAMTMLKEVVVEEDAFGDTTQQGIMWLGSFFDSIRRKGDNSLVNIPLLGSMGTLSHKMKDWWGWSDDTFDKVRQSNQYEAVAFQFGRLRAWIEKSNSPETQDYIAEMTNIIFLDANAEKEIDLKKVVSREELETPSGMLGKFARDKIPDLTMTPAQMTEFLNNSEMFEGIPDVFQNWEDDSMWKQPLYDYLDRTDYSEPATYDRDLRNDQPNQALVNFRAVEPPLTDNMGDLLNIMTEECQVLRCIALTEDNRPCANARTKGPYCDKHKSLGSELLPDMIQRLARPELVKGRYELIRGVFMRMPERTNRPTPETHKPRINGANAEFEYQMKQLSNLLR